MLSEKEFKGDNCESQFEQWKQDHPEFEVDGVCRGLYHGIPFINITYKKKS